MYQKDQTVNIIIWAIVLSPLLVMYVKRSWLALYGLILYLPLSGYIAIMFDRHPLAIQAMDFLFIIPAYLGFIPILHEKFRYSGIPRVFTLVTMLFVVLVLLQLMNPSPSNLGLLVGLVGVKVWLFNIPLLMLIYVHVSTPKRFITMLRLINISVWPAAVYGIVQFWACNTFGYKKTMEFLYGDYASLVTQSFSAFNVDGNYLYRIPSTFQTSAHYGLFLLGTLAFCHMSTVVEQNRAWKLFARTTLFLIVIASFLSGIRAMFIFVPMLFLIASLCHSKGRGLIKLTVILSISWYGSTYFSGFELTDVFSKFGNLAVQYSTTSPTRLITGAIMKYPLGGGTGINTIPARHVLPFSGADKRILGNESYFAKAIVETGILGGILVFLMLLIPLLVGIKGFLSYRPTEIRAVLGSAFAYQFVIFIYCTKGQLLDTAPTNIFYWMAVGITFRLNSFLEAPRQVAVPAVSQRPMAGPSPVSRPNIPVSPPPGL